MAHARDPQQGPSEKQRRRQSGPSGPKPEDRAGDLEKVRKAAGNAAMSQLLDPRTSQTIEASLGGGKSLQEAAPGQRAPRDAAGVGPHEDVRVHDDATAADVSKKLGAVAFTFGNDIFLAGDAPELGSSEGQRVLRHELTHVRQQDAANPGRPRKVSSPSSPAEREATHVGDHGSTPTAAAPAGAVHRQEEEEEMLQPMPAGTVHRQEEEEEMLQPMPAGTVHRQEEEEEMLQPMPAETVHREEMEEEEVLMMPAETVHREGEKDIYEGEAGAPVNAALSGLYDETVSARIAAAMEYMAEEPPAAESAMGELFAASRAIRAVRGPYEESDPLLYQRLRAVRNWVHVVKAEIAPLAGFSPDLGRIRSQLPRLHAAAGEISPDLH